MLTSLTSLWVAFGVAAGILVLLIVYRAVIGIKEDDQLFLDPDNAAETRVQSEQQSILMRVNRLTLYIRVLWVTSGAALLAIAGVWIYRGFVGFTHPSLEP
ncbi:MAG TPA: hypothetical protein VF146_05850 [Bryobacteraceae bacterium]